MMHGHTNIKFVSTKLDGLQCHDFYIKLLCYGQLVKAVIQTDELIDLKP